MKLGIALLILGVIFASAGLGLRQSGIRQQTTGLFGIPLYGEQALQRGATQESIGLGLLGLGGGLFVSGIIITIVRRQSKDKQ
jgi:hypothetical protein